MESALIADSLGIASVTQGDVAREAGVSSATVSRAFQGHPGIPEKTRLRVLAVSRKLGYRPNPFVVANMKRVRHASSCGIKALLAYIVPRPLSSYVREVPAYRLQYEAAVQRAHDLGFGLDVLALEENGVRLSARRCESILKARGVQGALIAPPDNPFARLRIDWRGLAVVSIGFPLFYPRVSLAATDHYHNMSLAMRRLWKLGYRRIGLAIPARADRYARNEFSAVYCFCSDNWPADSRIERLRPDSLHQWSEDTFMSWYDRNQPDAIVCINDEVRHWLAKRGIMAPDHVGLAHLSWEAEKEDWSGVSQCNSLVAAAAVQLVVDQLTLNERGIPAHPRSVLIGGRWVSGRTVRPQRGGSS